MQPVRSRKHAQMCTITFTLIHARAYTNALVLSVSQLVRLQAQQADLQEEVRNSKVDPAEVSVFFASVCLCMHEYMNVTYGDVPIRMCCCVSVKK
jgi:hypothetical protein